MTTTLYHYKTEPYAHQVFAVGQLAKIFSKQDYAAVFAEQGTGKTKITIDLANAMVEAGLIDRVLVIAPNGVHRQWAEQEIPTHSYLQYNTYVWKAGDQKKLYKWLTKLATNKVNWLMTNVETYSASELGRKLFAAFVQRGKTLVVVDEATDIGNISAARTENIIFGLSDLKSRRSRTIAEFTPYSKYRLILTGTPWAQGVLKLFGMTQFLHWNLLATSKTAYAAKYGMSQKLEDVRQPVQMSHNALRRLKQGVSSHEDVDEYTIGLEYGVSPDIVRYIREHPDLAHPYRYVDELKAACSEFSVSLQKKDCLDLPDKLFETRYVSLSKEQLRMFKELKNEAEVLYNNHQLTAATTQAIRIRLRQIAGGFFPYNDEEETASMPIGECPVKVDAVLRAMEELDGSQVIIVTAFRAEAKFLHEKLSKRYAGELILGGISASEKQRKIETFQRNEVQYIVATEHTIARGYNLQNAHYMYFYSITDSMEDYFQIQDRIHRLGQTEPPTYLRFVAQNSPDIDMLAATRNAEDFSGSMTQNYSADALMAWFSSNV